MRITGAVLAAPMEVLEEVLASLDTTSFAMRATAWISGNSPLKRPIQARLVNNIVDDLDACHPEHLCERPQRVWFRLLFHSIKNMSVDDLRLLLQITNGRTR